MRGRSPMCERRWKFALFLPFALFLIMPMVAQLARWHPSCNRPVAPCGNAFRRRHDLAAWRTRLQRCGERWSRLRKGAGWQPAHPPKAKASPRRPCTG